MAMGNPLSAMEVAVSITQVLTCPTAPLPYLAAQNGSVGVADRIIVDLDIWISLDWCIPVCDTKIISDLEAESQWRKLWRSG